MFECGAPAVEILGEFSPGHISVSVEVFSGKSANLLYYILNYGVNFISKKESIDTTTPAGRLMLTIFAGLYQFEREVTLERQREGIAIAKQAGKYKGRKPLSIDRNRFKMLYSEWKAGRMTAVSMQKQLGLTAPTFYRRVKEFEERGIV